MIMNFSSATASDCFSRHGSPATRRLHPSDSAIPHKWEPWFIHGHPGWTTFSSSRLFTFL